MKKETIAQETRRGYAYLKQKVKDGNGSVQKLRSNKQRIGISNTQKTS